MTRHTGPQGKPSSKLIGMLVAGVVFLASLILFLTVTRSFFVTVLLVVLMIASIFTVAALAAVVIRQPKINRNGQ